MGKDKNKNKKKKKKGKEYSFCHDQQTGNNEITLAQAQLWTKIWRIACPTNCKAFSIPVKDLIGVLKEIGVIQDAGKGLYEIDEKTENGVRAYMAIDPCEDNGGGEKILIVGTRPGKDDKGKIIQKDIINTGGELDDTLDGDPDTGIWDFTNPCPDMCDPESPLY